MRVVRDFSGSPDAPEPSQIVSVRIVLEAGIGRTDFLSQAVVEGELLAERLARERRPRR